MRSLPVGSYVRVQVTGHVGVMTPDYLARQVSSYLQASGQCNVAQNACVPARDIMSDLLAGNLLSWDYIANLQLQTIYPFDSETEGKSELVDLCRQAFADVTSNEPTGAFLVGTDTGASGNAPVPAQPTSVFDTFFADVSSVGSGIGAVFSGVQSDIKIALFGVLALAIVVAVLIAFGPNVPKLVPAIAV